MEGLLEARVSLSHELQTSLPKRRQSNGHRAGSRTHLGLSILTTEPLSGVDLVREGLPSPYFTSPKLFPLLPAGPKGTS